MTAPAESDEVVWTEADFEYEKVDETVSDFAPDPGKTVGFRIGKGVLRNSELQPYERQAGDPLERPLRIFALDEGASRLDGRDATVKVPYEPTEPGPIGTLFEVDNCDLDNQTEYRRVDLNEPALLLQNGRDPAPDDPRFHQQMVYAVASLVYDKFRRALGRHPGWAFSRPDATGCTRLILRPFHKLMKNAYYDRDRGEICFGYFSAAERTSGRNLPKGIVFTALSHDVIAHEVSHALLDGLRPLYQVPTRPDVLAFHEAFSDLVAVFLRFTYPEVVRAAIRASKGQLRHAQLLVAFAKQFGDALGLPGPLRVVADEENEEKKESKETEDKPKEYKPGLETHDLGSVLVRAVFEAFETIFRRKTARYRKLATGGSGVLPPGDLPADLAEVLALEASKLAGQFLNILIRAIDYCPPVDLSFGEFLRAVITADRDLVPDDPWAYREAWVDAFARRQIYPEDVPSVSESALLWRPPSAALPTIEPLKFGELYLSSDPARPAGPKELCRQARVLGKFVSHPERLQHFGLQTPGPNVGPPIVESIRSLRRIGPDGQVAFDLVALVTQEIVCKIAGAPFHWWCGSTVIIGPKGELRYVVYSGAPDAESEDALQQYLGGNGNSLWSNTPGEPRRHLPESVRELHRTEPG